MHFFKVALAVRTRDSGNLLLSVNSQREWMVFLTAVTWTIVKVEYTRYAMLREDLFQMLYYELCTFTIQSRQDRKFAPSISQGENWQISVMDWFLLDYLISLLDDCNDFSWSSAKASHAVLLCGMEQGEIKDFTETDKIDRVRRAHVQRHTSSSQDTSKHASK